METKLTGAFLFTVKGNVQYAVRRACWEFLNGECRGPQKSRVKDAIADFVVDVFAVQQPSKEYQDIAHTYMKDI